MEQYDTFTNIPKPKYVFPTHVARIPHRARLCSVSRFNFQKRGVRPRGVKQMVPSEYISAARLPPPEEGFAEGRRKGEGKEGETGDQYLSRVFSWSVTDGVMAPSVSAALGVSVAWCLGSLT
ncbi:hypothetical protein E2C01_053820 [Portunus trituberculatus]|uniref:Uncharacterized protein n=1 Tax=Portunus trituberculatus TaxID=210409 RepID=A0A5B7GLC6_PORTR|nr:hypothetical protein [Portunus trituberculatus]